MLTFRNIESLLWEENAEDVICFAKWLIKSKQNTVFTGMAGTNKLTLLKSLHAFSNSCVIMDDYSDLDKYEEFWNGESISFHDVFITDLRYHAGTTLPLLFGKNYRSIHFSMFCDDTKEMMKYICNDMITLGMAKSWGEAIKKTTDVLPVEFHAKCDYRNFKTLERVTEIVPAISSIGHDCYHVRNIFERQRGKYVLVNKPSDNLINRIKSNLSELEKEQFERDMEKILANTNKWNLYNSVHRTEQMQEKAPVAIPTTVAEPTTQPIITETVEKKEVPKPVIKKTNTRILVNADACPVVKPIETIAKKYNVEVILFSDTNHEFHSDYCKTKTVEKGKDAVDFAIVTECKEEDIIVTQDYGLASMVLGKKARAIHISGREFTLDNIDFLLFGRHIARIERKKHRGKVKKTPAGKVEGGFYKNFERMVKESKFFDYIEPAEVPTQDISVQEDNIPTTNPLAELEAIYGADALYG